MFDLILIRALFIVVLGCAAYFLQPLGLSSPIAAVLGVVAGAGVVVFEIRIKQVSLKRLIGAAFGSVLGILGAYLISLVLGAAPCPTTPTPFRFSKLVLLAWMTYCGLVVGAAKGDMLNLAALGGLFGGEKASKNTFKILDTSVIIDGRIADIAETGFIDGALVIPQFVLRELQLVADSSDSMKRNRGRRGLDVLQRIQKMPQLNVQIVEDDFPNVREVDMKLIELAKVYDCKIVTNDFNLNKVAQLHGVEVLNINELANALKPVVLPGETMRVFILKEGKEYNQGVAYLDDGTMVVVDNARKMISKTIDIAVTSVLQTTAGKMIFGRFDERTHTVHDKERRPGACTRRRTPAPLQRAGQPGLRRAALATGSIYSLVQSKFTMKVSVILPAAGLGTRMGREKSGTSRKQFMLLEGAPILIHTIRKFLHCPSVTEIVVALRAEDMDWARGLIHQEHPAKTGARRGGRRHAGSNRSKTRLATLAADTDLVAVHDAVRPFIDSELVEQVIAEAAQTGAAIVGIVPVDTVKQVHKNKIRATLPREHLVLAQTPQVFRFDLLKRAFERRAQDSFTGTDEASLVERLEQVEVSVVQGSDRNIKITKPTDMDLARLFLAEGDGAAS